MSSADLRPATDRSVLRRLRAAGDTTRDGRGRVASMPPILHYGFRPFFFLAALYAGLAVPAWLAIYLSVLVLPGPFQGMAHQVSDIRLVLDEQDPRPPRAGLHSCTVVAEGYPAVTRTLNLRKNHFVPTGTVSVGLGQSQFWKEPVRLRGVHLGFDLESSHDEPFDARNLPGNDKEMISLAKAPTNVWTTSAERRPWTKVRIFDVFTKLRIVPGAGNEDLSDQDLALRR